jgi:hypothetical protein
VISLEVYYFLGAQGGIIHAPEEGDQALSPRPLGMNSIQKAARLIRVDDSTRVHRPQRSRLSPFHLLERVRRERSDFAGVLHGVVEHHSLTVGGIGGSHAAIQFLADSFQHTPRESST